MAKPLSEHQATLRGKKKRGKGEQDDAMHAIEYVPGGGVRRIVYGEDPSEPVTEFEERVEFEEEEVEESTHVVEFEEEEREPEPRPAPLGDARDAIFNANYAPQHLADIDHIRFEVDNLHMLKQQYSASPSKKREPGSSRDVYSTDRGGVREAFAPTSEGTRRVLYTTRREGAREREQRFSHASVDRLIAGVSLKEEQVIEETVTEYETRKVRKPASVPRDYKGDVHAVVDLEGIGPAYAARLHDAGIEHTQDLLFADDKMLVERTGAPAKTVAQWKAMAELVKVSGIGPQYAEALARSGITSIEELRRRKAGSMAKDVNNYLNSLNVNVLGTTVTEKRIANWQKNAKGMRRVPIHVDKIQVRALESRAAIAGSKSKKAPAKKAAAKPKKAVAKKAPAKKAAAKKPAAKSTAKATTCAAKTAAGKACKRPPRKGSKYCSSHKGYRA